MEGFFRTYLNLYRPSISSINELLSQYELSYSLWQVVLYIKLNGPSSLVDISNHYHVEKPAITKRVKRLMELEMIEHISGKDKREKIIQLTDLGETLYQTCREAITNLEASMLDGITLEEQQLLFDILQKIRNNLLRREHKHEKE